MLKRKSLFFGALKNNIIQYCTPSGSFGSPRLKDLHLVGTLQIPDA
jgi:hypothetical protein